MHRKTLQYCVLKLHAMVPRTLLPVLPPLAYRHSSASAGGLFSEPASRFLLPQNRSALDSRSSASAESDGGDGGGCCNAAASDATSRPDVAPESSAVPVAVPGVGFPMCAGAVSPAAALPRLCAPELEGADERGPPAGSAASSCRAASSASDCASRSGGSGAGAKAACCPCLRQEHLHLASWLACKQPAPGTRCRRTAMMFACRMPTSCPGCYRCWCATCIAS